MNKEDLSTYKDMIPEMFESVSQAIGIHVMLLVLEHALWKTRCKYEEANLISFSEEGIFLEKLDTLEPEKAQAIIFEFVMAVVATLGRLVGIQLAQQLTEQLQEKFGEE